MADRSIEITFREQVAALRASDKRSALISKDEYFNLIEELKAAAACGDKTKTPKQYYILKRYEVLQCGDVEKLVNKKECLKKRKRQTSKGVVVKPLIIVQEHKRG